MTRRVEALDALRGLLALTVVVYHHPLGAKILPTHMGHWCVCAFFVLSGFVLAKSYDGKYTLFLLRRFLRLWPLFSFCTILAASFEGKFPPLAELAWSPFALFGGNKIYDPPAWTLFMEAWASLILPFIFFLSRRFALFLFLLATVISYSPIPFAWVIPMFAYGAILSRYNILFPSVTFRPLLLLGQISFPLYLSHWILNDLFGYYWAIPLYLPVAYVLHKTVEVPSLQLSRNLSLFLSVYKQRTA